MRAGIITIHFGINYGSALQAFAMSEIIGNIGLDTEIIDYIPERYSRRARYFEKSGIAGKLKCLAAFPFRFGYQHIFRSFLKKNLPLSKRCESVDELTKNCCGYDVYFAGSDQIWNSNYNKRVDPVYYLSFAPEKAKKIAYAASFGKSELEAWETKDTEILLHNFDAVSVREEQAKAIVNKLGYDAVHVLDPTMLIDKSIWSEKFSPRGHSEPYVLVYALNHEEKTLVRFARRIADKHSLKVKLISFSYFGEKIPGSDECLTYQSPDDFVRLMAGADYVVTNSFHGVAFSINLNKQFIAVKRKLYNSRLESILKKFELSERMVMEELPEALLDTDIDYGKCNAILDESRRESLRFITDSLS